jgi:hypothetical protein
VNTYDLYVVYRYKLIIYWLWRKIVTLFLWLLWPYGNQALLIIINQQQRGHFFGTPCICWEFGGKHQWIFYNKALFTWDRNKVKPGSFHFGQSIIYNRCLHETGTKITWTGLKSLFRLLDRANRLQTGMTSDRHEFRPGWM